MRTAVHAILVDAHNANLYDLEAHRAALAAAAQRIKAQEMLTGKAQNRLGPWGRMMGQGERGGGRVDRGS